MKKQNIIAFLLCLFVITVFLFSVCFVSEHWDHHCNDEHCAICVHLKIANNVLAQFHKYLAVLWGLGFCFFICLSYCFMLYCADKKCSSLIGQKVRLNN